MGFFLDFFMESKKTMCFPMPGHGIYNNFTDQKNLCFAKDAEAGRREMTCALVND
jgi:hypothetical protein